MVLLASQAKSLGDWFFQTNISFPLSAALAESLASWTVRHHSSTVCSHQLTVKVGSLVVRSFRRLCECGGELKPNWATSSYSLPHLRNWESVSTFHTTSTPRKCWISFRRSWEERYATFQVFRYFLLVWSFIVFFHWGKWVKSEIPSLYS